MLYVVSLERAVQALSFVMDIGVRMMKKLIWLLPLAWMLACNQPLPDPEPDPEPEVPVKPVTPVPADEVQEHSFLMGSILAFQKDHRTGAYLSKTGTDATTYYNMPLLDLYHFDSTDEDWWNSIVEQYEYAGLDFVMPNCRGRLPRAGSDPRYDMDHGDPTRIKDLIAAMKRRGTEHLKIAVFDDAPASWAAARNKDLYDSYVTVRGSAAEDAFPIADLDAFYKYVWDYNIKLAFANFYGENERNNKYLLRVDGKPFLMIWSPNGFVNREYGGVKPDCSTYLKAVLDRLHKDFKETFGEEVHICVDRAFADRDPYVTKAVTESMNDWFNTVPNSSSYGFSSHTFNNHTVGVAVPGFVANDRSGSLMFVDADHGKHLRRALDHMIRFKADVVVLEGFSDVFENAAYWRSSDTKYYDFPNQRLNILRRYSSTDAWPARLRVEAESCDAYKDLTAGNAGAQYRQGDLDVKRCVDGFPDWCVTQTQAGESLHWEELPYRAGKSALILRYSSASDSKIRFDVGGKMGAEVVLPSSGGVWRDAEVAELTFEQKGWHPTDLQIVSGNPDINYFFVSSSDFK